jgi:hypothetical protein
MNHLDSWHPEKYTLETKVIEVKLLAENEISEKYAEDLGKQLGIDDKFRRYNVKKRTFKISFEKHDVEIDMKTGKGEIVAFSKTPFISQTMKLNNIELVDLLFRYFWNFIDNHCFYRSNYDTRWKVHF